MRVWAAERVEASGRGEVGRGERLGRVWAGGLPGWGLGWVVLGLSFLSLSISFPF